MRAFLKLGNRLLTEGSTSQVRSQSVAPSVKLLSIDLLGRRMPGLLQMPAQVFEVPPSICARHGSHLMARLQPYALGTLLLLTLGTECE